MCIYIIYSIYVYICIERRRETEEAINLRVGEHRGARGKKGKVERMEFHLIKMLRQTT